MLVLFTTQLFMQDFWGALGTLGALILNIAITAFHQARSAKQVGKLLSALRGPKQQPFVKEPSVILIRTIL
jgi:hypothetical protein